MQILSVLDSPWFSWVLGVGFILAALARFSSKRPANIARRVQVVVYAILGLILIYNGFHNLHH